MADSGDSTENNSLANQHALYYDEANSKLNVKTVKDAKDGPVSSDGQYAFAGLEDHYFAGVYIPEGRSLIEMTEFADTFPDSNGKADPRVGAAVGGEGSNSFTFFAGPKDYNLLGKINPKLEQLIDWSWLGISLGFIGKPLFLLLSWVADHLTRNYGWAIVLVTVGINTVLFPLRLTQLRSSKKMQSIQPLIKQLNEKYKSLPLKDPRQADKNQELMDLYKKHGINPVGGCLPMLIQLPFLVAFYKVLGVMVELRGASWLWVHDLSQPETLALHILPLILIATQYPANQDDPSTWSRPGAAENDDRADAPDDGLHFLLPVFRAGIILFDQQSGGHRAASDLEPRHAGAHTGRSHSRAQEKE